MALQSTCKVQIVVGDVNDNRPRFIEPKTSNVSLYATIIRNDVIAKVQVRNIFRFRRQNDRRSHKKQKWERQKIWLLTKLIHMFDLHALMVTISVE